MDAVAESLTLSPTELNELRRAKWVLENPSFAIRLANVIGLPIETGFAMLPKGWSHIVHRSVHLALNKTLRVAMKSLRNHAPLPSSDSLHRVIVGTSGAVGGAFGLASLPFELPLSTAVMLRSIADIARSEGYALNDVETHLACLAVFALGSRRTKERESENQYWIIRAGLARAVSEATTYLTNRGIVCETAPVMIRLVAAIAARFGVIVSEHVAAKAIPLVGAATGSAFNLVFINHFQRMARGHFVVKRLEKQYGVDTIESVYRSIAMPMSKKEISRFTAQSI
ncbi:MAG: hypothetical protein M2R45_01712 [Verrucomicrobia subdivision 3 bacterium]|nr:hypothetical protein [Limisphaerales bacterium]MCS1413450.1 hypothetical protein [Limisphaerales bacterium]